jgi:hypothetical protein
MLGARSATAWRALLPATRIETSELYRVRDQNASPVR